MIEGSITSHPFDESSLTFDHYNGVTLNLESIESSEDEFKEHLTQALTFWKAEGRKGTWIHAPLSKAHLIPVSRVFVEWKRSVRPFLCS